MPMPAGRVDAVIGVDAREHARAAAVVAPAGGLVAGVTIPADAFGARRVPAFARQHAPGRRAWAVEGSGSCGSGLATFLLEQGGRVVEVDRPARPARRDGAKSDELDAVRAAREALSRERLAQPRRRGDREAIRVPVCTREGAVLTRTRAIAHLHGLVVNAPEGIRNQLRKLTTDELLERCARLRTGPSQSVEHRATVTALRSTARRALACEAEAGDPESALEVIVERVAPQLLARPGVGVMSAARVLNARSHAGRIRTEAAFAQLAGVAPIPASSGQTVRHRLNRSGDRQLNRAMHTISSRGSSTILRRMPMPIAAGPRVGPLGRSGAASIGSPRGACSSSSSTRQRPLDRHRSIVATALGVQAARRGHRVAFATAHQWVNRLGAAKRAGRLDDELERLSRFPLLIVDEVGCIPFDPEAAALFFALISSRYERRSLIVSSNKTFSAWAEIFGDPVAVAAMVDRLVHHAEVIVLKGDSYRLRGKREEVLTGQKER